MDSVRAAKLSYGRNYARKVVKLARIVRVPAYRSALRHRVAAAVEHQRVPFLNTFSTIVDVGASRGQFALVARQRFPDAVIYCLEPLPEAAAVLRRVTRRDPNIRRYRVAAGAAHANLELHVSRADDSSSLLPIGRGQTSRFPGTEEVRTVLVPVTRLDDILPVDSLVRPVLLKVDVQGYELNVLQGADGLLEQVDELLIEASFVPLYKGQALANEVMLQVLGRGFCIVGLYSVVYGADGRCIQGDLHFARNRVAS